MCSLMRRVLKGVVGEPYEGRIVMMFCAVCTRLSSLGQMFGTDISLKQPETI